MKSLVASSSKETFVPRKLCRYHARLPKAVTSQENPGALILLTQNNSLESIQSIKSLRIRPDQRSGRGVPLSTLFTLEGPPLALTENP